VTSRTSFSHLAIVAALAAGTPGDVRAVSEPRPEPIRLGLYEWNGDRADRDRREHRRGRRQARSRPVVLSPIKGGLAVGAVILIDQRQANRDREFGVGGARPHEGQGVPLAVEALDATQEYRRRRSTTSCVASAARGCFRSKGGAATIAAAARLAEVQERRSDEFVWETLPDFLQDENPVLVDEALDLYVKFRRERVALVPVVQPLLEHPRPDVRRRAAILLGRVLVRAEAGQVAERPEVVAELMGRARRDDDVAVRREATSALAAVAGCGHR
jgi:HEAT repeat protein